MVILLEQFRKNPFFGGKETIMTNRAGTLVSNLSGEMAYESFRPAPLPPNPPIEVSGELVTKLMHSSQEAPDRSRSHLQHTQESCQRLRPSGVFSIIFLNCSTVIFAFSAARSIFKSPSRTSCTNIRISPMLMPSSLPSAFTP